jgi:uncharacterized membrane protein
MLPPPAFLILIPLPALAATLAGLRASLVLGAGLLGAVAYMALALFWPQETTEVAQDSYYVVGFAVFVQSLVVVAFVAAVAQAIKERLGRADRMPTVVSGLMALIGGALSLLPVTVSPADRVAGFGVVGEVGAFVFFAGVAGLVLTIVLRPIFRRIRGRG